MKIPRRQKDIKIKTYLEYENFIKNLTDEQKLDDEYVLFNTIRIFYQIDKNKFDELPYQTILDMRKIIENIFKMKIGLKRIIKIKNKRYGINPDFDDMTFGEMVDCDTDDIIQQMAVLYRPIKFKIGKKYIIKKYDGDISHKDLILENIGLDVYLGFISFFLTISNDILSYTLNYSVEGDIPQEMMKNLVDYGDGLDGFMTYVKVI